MHHGEEHVGHHDEALARILDLHPDMAGRVAGQVDDRDAAHDLALAVDRLQPRIEAHHLGRHPEAGLQVVGGAAAPGRIGPVGDVAPVDMQLGIGIVLLPAGDQPAHVVFVHVGHDDRVDLVATQAEGGEGLRQRARLSDRAGRPGIDQDPALAILDQVLVEHEADAAGPGDELRRRRLLDLGGGAARKIGVGHVRVAVRQRGHGEAADPDLRQRRHACRWCRGGRAPGRGDERQEAGTEGTERKAAPQGAAGQVSHGLLPMIRDATHGPSAAPVRTRSSSRLTRRPAASWPIPKEWSSCVVPPHLLP